MPHSIILSDSTLKSSWVQAFTSDPGSELSSFWSGSMTLTPLLSRSGFFSFRGGS